MNILKYNGLPAIFFFSALLMFSCQEDPVNNEPDINAPFVALNYDGSNQDAPLLPTGNYEAAIYFPASELNDLTGGKLIEVYYYIRELPASCTIKIYSKTSDSSPVELEYSAATGSDLLPNTWNKHILSTPVEITGEDIWIAVSLGHGADTRSIGCDPGPAVSGGDWLFDSGDGNWIPLSQRAGISINWNIRGVVEP